MLTKMLKLDLIFYKEMQIKLLGSKLGLIRTEILTHVIKDFSVKRVSVILTNIL